MIRFPFYLCNYSIQICLFSVASVIYKITIMIRYKFKIFCGRILFAIVLLIYLDITQARRYCSSSYPCYLNEGYCSGYSSRCYGNLVCGYNNCQSSVYSSSDDCCECNCNGQGHTGHCNTYGTCYCKEGYTGNKCTECASGYFGFPDCKRIHTFTTLIEFMFF